MKKTGFIILFLAGILCFGIKIFADSAIKCENGFVNKTLKFKKSGIKVCHNPQTGISYENAYGDVFYFYKDGIYCGNNCDYDGKNCQKGFCNVNNCNKEKGYTQLIKINDKYENMYCYNPKTHLAYRSNDIAESIGGDKVFYYNNEKCGYSCDFDGKNCRYGGVCNISDCDTLKGYTEIKDGKCYNPLTNVSAPKCDAGYEYNVAKKECKNPKTGLSYFANMTQKSLYYKDGIYCGKLCDVDKCAKDKGYTQLKVVDNSMACYNPNTHISYNWLETFYIDNMECGKNCDLDGKNCKYEKSCYDCDREKGYTINKSGRCYNPQTGISYEGKNFYVNDYLCGYNCNINGKNCDLGACFADECMRKYGYPEIKYGMCHNPKTFLSRAVNTLGNQNNTFYYKSEECGKTCDNDGKNCKFTNSKNTIGGHIIKGICNIEDCPKGYKQIYTNGGYGMCKSEIGNIIVFSDEKGKFHNFQAGVSKDFATAPIKLMKYLHECFKYGYCS